MKTKGRGICHKHVTQIIYDADNHRLMKKELYINLLRIDEDTNTSLPKILGIFSDKGKKSLWRIEYAEACGYEDSAFIHEWSDSKKDVSGEEFYSVLTPRIQIIDGIFKAREMGSNDPWVEINVQDGAHITVSTESESIADGVMELYPTTLSVNENTFI